MTCRAHLSQLRQHKNELDELGVQVKVITFDADWMAVAYVKKTRMPWPLLLDSAQELYIAYGMKRSGWRGIYGLSSVVKYIALIVRGTIPGKPGKDWHQLGGDVLIDPEGIVRLQYVSDDPHDRPSVESLLEIVRA